MAHPFKKLWSGNKRFRLMLTLDLAVMLPAAALIYVNFDHLKSIQRDKVLEAWIHRDFEEMLAISEKKINHKAATMLDEVRENFPSPGDGTDMDMKARLDLVLSKAPWLAHVFLFDENGFLLRSQPQGTSDRNLCEEHEFLSKMFRGWFDMEAKMILEGIQKKSRPFSYDSFEVKRPAGYAFMTTALFTLPGLPKDRVVLGGASFEPDYLKQSFFPQMLEELITTKSKDEGGNRLAMEVFPADSESGHGERILAASGWREGKPEVSRNLIVEDEPAMVAGLRDNFEYEGYEVISAGDGEAGLERVMTDDPSLVVLDVMMPRMSGLEVCKRIKAKRPSVPIIMLTARGQEIDKVVGLELGADDYVTKPFSIRELMARVKAVLRRVSPQARVPEVYRFSDVEVNLRGNEVRRAGRPVPLSTKEFALLAYFIAHPAQTLSRERLLDAVWGYENYPNTRTVDTHIAHLRQKLEPNPEAPRYILTVHGTGYKFAE